MDWQKIEFVLASLRLDFHDPYRLTVEHLLRLRRNLRQAARQLELQQPAAKGLDFAALFDPPLPVDLFAQKRYQLSGPPFVIHPPTLVLPHSLDGTLELPVVLWGTGTRRLRELCAAFQALGARGFHRGEGLFDLAAVDVRDLAGNRTALGLNGGGGSVAPPVIHAGWWLDGSAAPLAVRLQFATPARLLSNGRPLFRPTFKALFPFILRRLSSMVYAHCQLELVDDPQRLLAAVAQLEETDNRLAWQDWRVLEGNEQQQELGGIVGSVTLAGAALNDIFWVLRLGTLLNLGKGASFGAGHYTLHELN